jgi:hypothetical protein
VLATRMTLLNLYPFNTRGVTHPCFRFELVDTAAQGRCPLKRKNFFLSVNYFTLPARFLNDAGCG